MLLNSWFNINFDHIIYEQETVEVISVSYIVYRVPNGFVAHSSDWQHVHFVCLVVVHKLLETRFCSRLCLFNLCSRRHWLVCTRGSLYIIHGKRTESIFSLMFHACTTLVVLNIIAICISLFPLRIFDTQLWKAFYKL